MSEIYDSYNLPLAGLAAFYPKLNAEITYPDGMITSLGIIYWGKPEHTGRLENAVPVFLTKGIYRFSDLLEATRTPARMYERKSFSIQTI